MPKNSQVIESFKKRIFQSTKVKDKIAVLNILKKNYSIAEIKQILPHILSHPLTSKFVYGVPLPKNYKQLRSGFYSMSTTFTKELDWLRFSLIKYSTQINQFISEKHDYERLALSGNYENAKIKLKSINENICFSIWGLENQFLIEEFTGGLEKNKEFLSKINEDGSDMLVSLLADFYSNKAEKKLSIFRFYSILEDFMNGLNKGFQQYWSIRFNYLNTLHFSQFGEILSYESKSSIIDKYLTFLRICQWISLNGSYEDKLIVRNNINIMVNKINDPLLNNLLIYFNPELKYSFSTADKMQLEVLDKYTAGNYIEALTLSASSLLQYPHDLCLYEIYVKCLFYLNKGFKPLNDVKSLLNEILEDIYNIYEKNEHTGTSVSRLMKSVNVLDSFSISQQIFSFLEKLIPGKEFKESRLPGFINYSFLNPFFYKTYTSLHDSQSFLNSTLKSFPNSPTLQFHFSYINQINSKITNDFDFDKIPSTRIKFYKSKALLEIGNYNDAILILEDLLNIKTNQVVFEEIIVNLFDCYRETKNYDKCIELYISSYLKNNNNTIRFQIGSISKNIEKAKFRNITPSINVPLFFFLTKQDNHSINVALRVFLRSLSINKPPQLAAFIHVLNKQLLTEFLLKVCTVEILKYSIYFKSTKDILNERLEIYQLLIQINPEEVKTYKLEIRKISQSLAIIEGIREVDESKIYVDERGLISNEFGEIENNFNRYIEISNLIKERPFFFIDVGINKKFLFKVLDLEQYEEEVSKAKLSKDFKLGLFKELFYEILNRFLFSNKYGLDSYLSTRIRHGTLLGQLRSEFQKQFLITQKDKITEEYYKNEYWNNKLDLNWETTEEIQELLASFSLKIDQIANNLKEKYIQIRTPNKKEGLFDYDFTSNSLDYYYEHYFNTIDNYESFVKGIFIFIWEKTRTNLEIIQNIISKDIKGEIIENLIKLEKDLKDIVEDPSDIQELINNITNCRTQIISEIDKISEWFKIRESITSDFKIDKVIDTSIEITKKTSQINTINVHSNINSETLIKGEFFIHFFDLIRIFLENAVSYSQLQPAESQLKINVDENNDVITIEIYNNLSPEFEISELEEFFKKRMIDLNKPEWNMEVLKTEIGGTGFYKAKKILETNLLSESNKLLFSVDEFNNVKIVMKISLAKIKV